MKRIFKFMLFLFLTLTLFAGNVFAAEEFKVSSDCARVYKAKLQEIITSLEENWNGTDCKNHNVPNLKPYSVNVDITSYRVEDITNDAVPELIVFYSYPGSSLNPTNLAAIYTLRENNAEPIFLYQPQSYEEVCYLTDNNYVDYFYFGGYNLTSGTVTATVDSYLKLTNTGTEPSEVIGSVYDERAEKIVSYFHLNHPNEREETISKDEYDSYKRKYSVRTLGGNNIKDYSSIVGADLPANNYELDLDKDVWKQNNYFTCDGKSINDMNFADSSKLFLKLDNTEEYKAQQSYYNEDNELVGHKNGHCFGLSLSTALAKVHLLNDARVTDYDYLHDVPFNDDTKSLIEYYHLLQYTNRYGNYRDEIVDKYTKVVGNGLWGPETIIETDKIIKDLATTVDLVKDGNMPVFITLHLSIGNHATLAYALENKPGSFTTPSGETYDNCIYMYDPNSGGPNSKTYKYDTDYHLYFSYENDQHGFKWEIPEYRKYGMYDDGNGNEGEGAIFFFSNDIFMLSTLGLDNSNVATIESVQPSYASISTPLSSGSFTITDQSSGETWTVIPSQKIVAGGSSGLTHLEDENNLVILLPNKSSSYQIEPDSGQTVKGTYSSGDFLYNFSVGNSNGITLSPNGTVNLAQTNSNYSIDMVSNKIDDSKLYVYTVSGSSSDGMDLSFNQNGLKIQGSDLKDTTVTGKNLKDKVTKSKTIDENETSADVDGSNNNLTVNQENTSDQPSKPEAKEYSIQSEVSPSGSGTVTGSGKYSDGKEVTLKASANSGYRFVKWTEDSSTVSTSSSYTFTVHSDRTLTAVFEKSSSSSEPVGDAVPVYRLYNEELKEHLYTTDAYEVSVLTTTAGWKSEGIGWQSPSSGTPVYRLYSPITHYHLFTSDTNEVHVLTTQRGWQQDFDGDPLFYSGGSTPIYRLYHENQRVHHLTKDQNEYSVLGGRGWNQEGIKFYALSDESSDTPTQPETPSQPSQPSKPESDDSSSSNTQNDLDVSYEVHMEELGWCEASSNGSTAGQPDSNLKLEAFMVDLPNNSNIGIAYAANIEHIGWQEYVSEGEIAGTTGQDYAMYGIKMHLTGSDASDYDILYRVHTIGNSWTSWSKNDQVAGSSNLDQKVNAIQIRIVSKS